MTETAGHEIERQNSQVRNSDNWITNQRRTAYENSFEYLTFVWRYEIGETWQQILYGPTSSVCLSNRHKEQLLCPHTQIRYSHFFQPRGLSNLSFINVTKSIPSPKSTTRRQPVEPSNVTRRYSVWLGDRIVDTTECHRLITLLFNYRNRLSTRCIASDAGNYSRLQHTEPAGNSTTLQLYSSAPFYTGVRKNTLAHVITSGRHGHVTYISSNTGGTQLRLTGDVGAVK